MNKRNWQYKRFGRGAGKKNLPLNICCSNDSDVRTVFQYVLFSFLAVSIICSAYNAFTKKDVETKNGVDVIGLVLESKPIEKPVTPTPQTQSPVPDVHRKPPFESEKPANQKVEQDHRIDPRKAESSPQDKVISAKLDNSTTPRVVGRQLSKKEPDDVKIIKKKSSIPMAGDESTTAKGEIKTAERTKKRRGDITLKVSEEVLENQYSHPILEKDDGINAVVSDRPQKKMNLRHQESLPFQPYEPVVLKHDYEAESSMALNESPKTSQRLYREDDNIPSGSNIGPTSSLKKEVAETQRFSRNDPFNVELKDSSVPEQSNQIIPPVRDYKPKRSKTQVTADRFKKSEKKLRLREGPVEGSGRGDKAGEETGSGSGSGTGGGLIENEGEYSDDPARSSKFSKQKGWSEISEHDLPICPSGFSDTGIKGEIIHLMQDADLGPGATCSNDNGVFRFHGKLGIYLLTVKFKSKSKVKFKNRCEFLSNAYECLVKNGGKR